MPLGGRRPGAGRPLGSANRRTREIADKAASGGITPLEVMLTAMRKYVEAENWDDARAAAKDAAPYMHPRLNAVEYKERQEGDKKPAFTWLPPS